MTLKIGRIDTGRNETTWTEAPGSVTITGKLIGPDLATVLYLREELIGQLGPRLIRRPIAITSTLDPTRSGFFWLDDVDIEATHDLASYQANGFLEFTVTAERVGSEGLVEIQSNLTTALMANTHGVDATECTFWHAVPPLANNYTVTPPSQPIATTRDSEEGSMQLFLDIDPDEDDPRWSITPADYYSGAARITVDGRLRAGEDVAHNPDVWTIENGIIRISPTGGVPNNGRLQIERWNGSTYTSPLAFAIDRGVNVIPNWNYMAITQNEPEVCIVHLERDADEATPTAFRHTLDILLRRGASWARCYYSYTGPVLDYTVRRDASDNAVAISPGVAATPVGIMDNAGTFRWMILSTHEQVQNLTTGAIDIGNTTPVRTFDFALGVTDEGDANGAGISLAVQYLGWSDEQAWLATR